jgi:uncharacterized protein YggT (Ycf19 family)
MWRSYRRDYVAAGTLRDCAGASRWGAVVGVAPVLGRIFALLYCVLGTRLVLALVEARKDSSFYQVVRAISGPVYAPFKDIVAPGFIANHPLVWSLVIAILAYALAHAVLGGLLRLAAREHG